MHSSVLCVQVEQYGTQTPLALLRQHMDYQSWFDRDNLQLKKRIDDVQFVAAMNHKAGSFTINPRLQRHFAVFATQIPSDQDLHTIYSQIVASHIEPGRFEPSVIDTVPTVLSSTFRLITKVSRKFMASAVRAVLHY